MPEIRPAHPDDDAALAELDQRNWNTLHSPAPAPTPGTPFFDADGASPEDILVATDGDRILGYVRIDSGTIPAQTHVSKINGLIVEPDVTGRGIGAMLVEAAVAEARRRGSRRLTLRVLAHNDRARRLYARHGFTQEGVLRGEFHLDGRDVDDVMMARDLTVAEHTDAPASA